MADVLTEPILIKGTDAGYILDVSAERVRQLAVDGVIPVAKTTRAGRLYDLAVIEALAARGITRTARRKLVERRKI